MLPRMMRINLQCLLSLAVSSALASAYTDSAAKPPSRPSCSMSDAMAASDYVDELGDWAAVAHFYDRFRYCDDGGTAEGVSDSIAKLLVRSQPQVSVLLRLEGSRRGMNEFILRHIDGTLDDDDLKVIADHLPQRCEPNAKHLCEAISHAARRALTSP
jgi:hypothetical protein